MRVLALPLGGTHGEGSLDVGGIRCVRSSGPSCSCRHATLDSEQIHLQNNVGPTYRAGGGIAAEAAGEDGGEAGRHGRSGDWHDRGTGRICTTRPRRRGARAVIRIHVPDHPTSHASPRQIRLHRPLPQCSTVLSFLDLCSLAVRCVILILRGLVMRRLDFFSVCQVADFSDAMWLTRAWTGLFNDKPEYAYG